MSSFQARSRDHKLLASDYFPCEVASLLLSVVLLCSLILHLPPFDKCISRTAFQSLSLSTQIVPLHLPPNPPPHPHQLAPSALLIIIIRVPLIIPPLVMQTVGTCLVVVPRRIGARPSVVHILPRHRPISPMRIIQKVLLHHARVKQT